MSQASGGCAGGLHVRFGRDPGGGDRAQPILQVQACEDRPYALESPGVRCVHVNDPGVGVRAPDDAGVEHARREGRLRQSGYRPIGHDGALSARRLTQFWADRPPFCPPIYRLEDDVSARIERFRVVLRNKKRCEPAEAVRLLATQRLGTHALGCRSARERDARGDVDAAHFAVLVLVVDPAGIGRIR